MEGIRWWYSCLVQLGPLWSTPQSDKDTFTADTAPPQALSHCAAAAVFGFPYFFATEQITGIKIPLLLPVWSDFLIIYVSIHGNKHLLFLCVQTINSTDPVLINRLPVWILWMTLLDSLLFPLKNKRFLSPKLWILLTGFVVTFVKWLWFFQTQVKS